MRGFLEPATPARLVECLRHALAEAGNWRILITMAGEWLDAAVQRHLKQLGEKLYLEIFAVPANLWGRRAKTSAAR